MIYNPDALSVLFVDDEQNLLDAIARHFRRQYNVFTANSGPEAIALIQTKGPFPIVVSDMKMPHMNGIDLLRAIRLKAPDTIRILLTGQANLNDAIAAINEGNIFRFLTKPCPLGTLANALDAARKQYELVTNQRILLEETLQGSIKMLVDILSMTNPAAFGKANRARQEMQELLPLIDLEGADRWPIEVAAMLSQIGLVALPPALTDKLYRDEPLTPEEQARVDNLPEITASLLGHIPRIEEVRAILRYQHKGYDGKGTPVEDIAGDQLPMGSRMLKLVHDYDRFFTRAGFLEPTIKLLLKHKASYDPQILAAFLQIKREQASQEEVRMIDPRHIKIGMVFATDILSASGHLLVARGQEVTPSLRDRIQHLFENGAIGKELPMILPQPEPEPETPMASAETAPSPEPAGDGSGDADDTIPLLHPPAGAVA